ncbi:MAG: hypothetical protein M1819_002998 [Sarea resinae]|nr:MAG: hypothetical protein M1819_002998 [Sarea resinae]
MLSEELEPGCRQPHALSLSPIMTTCNTTPTSLIACPAKAAAAPAPGCHLSCGQSATSLLTPIAEDKVRSQLSPSGPQFSDLPVEIHEAILDHLFGVRASTSSAKTEKEAQPLRSWSNVLRHPRRRQLSNLALVSATWRQLIQERLYRHVKVKGTTSELRQCRLWILDHPHLQSYVRHVEIWVPVWEKRAGELVSRAPHPPNYPSQARAQATSIINSLLPSVHENNEIGQTYQLASQNASLEEIFLHVDRLFPNARILTLEGGHCKKPPMIRYHDKFSLYHPDLLPVLRNIQTVVFKGTWNIMREEHDFHTLAASFPNIREWHFGYAKPKSQAYLTMAQIVPKLPPTLTHLNISLETSFSREATSPPMWRKVYPSTHICLNLGAVAPHLEALTYTGRMCSCFFARARRVAKKQQLHSEGLFCPKLKYVDIIVKNCCRAKGDWNDGTGMANWPFIQAFEALVTAGVESLETFTELNYLRIRFIDLESPYPLLNPYFHLQNNSVSGIWNESLLPLLSHLRPEASYAVPTSVSEDRCHGTDHDHECNQSHNPETVDISTPPPPATGPSSEFPAATTTITTTTTASSMAPPSTPTKSTPPTPAQPTTPATTTSTPLSPHQAPKPRKRQKPKLRPQAIKTSWYRDVAELSRATGGGVV